MSRTLGLTRSQMRHKTAKICTRATKLSPDANGPIWRTYRLVHVNSVSPAQFKLRVFCRGFRFELQRSFYVALSSENSDCRCCDRGHLKLTVESVSEMDDIDVLAFA